MVYLNEELIETMETEAYTRADVLEKPDNRRAGLVLGRYDFDDNPIASGGFSDIYLGYDPDNPEDRVAIRVLNSIEEAHKAYFRNGVDVHRAADAYQQSTGNPGKFFPAFVEDLREGIYVMEYIDGRTPGSFMMFRLENMEPLLIYAYQLAEALEAFHSIPVNGDSVKTRLVHRDLKPGNTIISKKGRTSLLDYDLAASGNQLPDYERENILGTAAFMSPEQITDIEVGQTSDMFSFGSTLYLIKYGYIFPGFNAYSTVGFIADCGAGRRSMVELHKLDYLDDIDWLIGECWRVGQRSYASSTELKNELHSMLLDNGIDPEDTEERLAFNLFKSARQLEKAI